MRDAHHEGVRAAMAVLEAEGAFVRRGRNGVRQEQVSGVLAAAFDHRTSRTGDPQLDTHVAVLAMAKNRCGGGVLVGRPRHLWAVGGPLGGVRLPSDKALARDLGVRFEVGERTGVREIAGVPTGLRALWSSRRAQITPRIEELKAGYTSTHGRPPSPRMVSKMGQWATLDTRRAKGPAETSAALFARWQTAALAAGNTDLVAVWAAATHRERVPVVARSEGEVVAAAIARLTAERSSWTVPNVMQVVWQVMDHDPTTTAADEVRARRGIGAVLGDGEVLKLTPTVGLDLPAELVRADGESVYEVHNTSRHATRTALADEQYLVARSQSKTITPPPAALIAAHVAVGERFGLSPHGQDVERYSEFR